MKQPAVASTSTPPQRRKRSSYRDLFSLQPLRGRNWDWRQIGWLLLGLLAVIGLQVYRLGSLTPGLSPLEHTVSNAAYGWHGIAQQPFYLPLELIRSIVFTVAGHHSAVLDRLPSILIGVSTVALFAILIKFWHGTRTAVLATILFACGSWLLHISRLASNDILYMSIPLTLLVLQLYMHKYGTKPLVFYGSLALCGICIFTPGMIWVVALSIFWQRAAIRRGWAHFKLWWQRTLYVATGLIWLPLLVPRLTHFDVLKNWLGLPPRFDGAEIGRQLAFVPVHLCIRGPADSERWLGHAPILGIFSLVMALAGIWFYVDHYDATRSRLLGSYCLLGFILVGLGGPVGLSLLVPMLYIFAATGIAYFLHEWLRVFPVNPFARRLGIGLVVFAVIVSGAYNVRAYFVAWPHDTTTLSTFRSQP